MEDSAITICTVSLTYQSFSRIRWYSLVLRSIGFAGECLGQHVGSDQSADLGDGNGYSERLFHHLIWYVAFQHCFISENETAVIRWDYGDPSVGTCKETIQGGNHFRYWVQNGPKANRSVLNFTPHFLFSLFISFYSGAIFMALSYEQPVAGEQMFLFVFPLSRAYASYM